MELHEFHVRHPRTGPPCHGNAIAGRAAWRGAEHIRAPRPAGGQNGRPRDEGFDFAGLRIERIDAPDLTPPSGLPIGAMPIGDKVHRNHVGAQGDIGMRARSLDQRFLHGKAGGIVDMNDTAV